MSLDSRTQRLEDQIVNATRRLVSMGPAKVPLCQHLHKIKKRVFPNANLPIAKWNITT